MNKLLYWQSHKGGFWFRLFGIGLSFQSYKQHPMSFSERNSYTKTLKIGRYRVFYLEWKPPFTENCRCLLVKNKKRIK